jgi:proline iminopeptidase
MDGVFQHFVRNPDMAPSCPQVAAPDAAEDRAAAGVGFWVNAVTTANAAQVADPRPALRTVTTPVLVLRGKCDYIAWDVTREYQEVLPNASVLTIDDAGHTIETHQLPARVLWLATLMLNSLALLLSIGGAAFLGLWCVILWQLSAIALSIVGLREQRF